MSKATVGQVIQRAVSDAAFRRQLHSDPGAALKGFDLTADERAAITSGDPARLTGLGVDQRMSKAFAIGAVAGSASKSVIELDPGFAGGDEVIVGDPGTAAVSAFDATTASGDMNTLDAGMVSGATAAREDMSTAGDLNAIDEGYSSPVSTARTDASTAGDLNTVDAGTVTAFEPASSSAGDLNALDAGIVSDDTVTSSGSADGAGPDGGGDIRPSEY